MYNEVSRGIAPPGVEYFLPMFFQRLDTVFDYLPETAVLVFDERVTDQGERFWQGAEERYENKRHDTEYPLLPPAELFLATDQIAEHARRFRKISCLGVGDPGGGHRVTPLTLPYRYRSMAMRRARWDCLSAI